jgi:hypothetical protein
MKSTFKHLAAGLIGLCMAASAAAQQMYAFRFNGDVLKVDTSTGAASFIGNLGTGVNAASWGPNGYAIVSTVAATVYEVDPATATIINTYNFPAWPTGYGPRGIAYDPTTGTIYAAMSQASTTVNDLLYTIDFGTLSYTLVGDMLRTDIQGLASDDSGNLYALGIFTYLQKVDKMTGACTTIGGTGYGPDQQTIEFGEGGTLFGCRENLIKIDLGTGNASLIGPTGFIDIRGLAWDPGGACYPDCDGSGTLDLFDFLCFVNAFNAGDPYADCDGSGTLDLFDFLCFVNEFNAGCP